jgi:hypothetical protein
LDKSSELNLENNGIEVIESEFMKLVCFQTLTRLKFIFVIDHVTSVSECEVMFRRIYDIYSDFVSKNPFYELDMPIRIETFETEVSKLL